METNFKLHNPQRGYTATIELTVTREEISALYRILELAEPSNAGQKNIKYEVLKELRSANDWITEKEEIRSYIQKVIKH